VQTPLSIDSTKIVEPIQPPSAFGLIREARSLIELPRLLLRAPMLARQPRGRGEPVLVFPGYGAGNTSTIVLQGYLRLLGYQVRGLGRGLDSRDVPALITGALKRLIRFARRTGQTVRIVGWSLGGYIAREVARERPDLVRQVITLGTPVVGGPKYTIVAHSLRRRGIDMDAIEAQIESRNRISLTTPVTAIYSRADGIVAWEACLDRNCRTVEHVEVRAAHLGLGFCPEVFRIIARRLAGEKAEQ
jgi:dienelactone hydrolase